MTDYRLALGEMLPMLLEKISLSGIKAHDCYARHNNSFNRSAIELVFHRQLVRNGVASAPG
jgi:hypothetical protein